MNNIKQVTRNKSVITRTVMPAQREPLRYSILSYAETVVVGAMVGLAIAFVIALVGLMTGCTTFVAQQVEQDVATSTIAPRLSHIDVDDELERFRQQTRHANEALATMKAYALEGGIR